MSDTSITLLRLSANLAMFVLKGRQGGMLQQQIEAMGLRQWLSLVAAWTTERVFAAVVTLRDFITPSPPALRLEHVAAKIAALTLIYLF